MLIIALLDVPIGNPKRTWYWYFPFILLTLDFIFLKPAISLAADYFYSAGTGSLLVKDFKMANNAYKALQRLSNQESYVIKKRKN